MTTEAMTSSAATSGGTGTPPPSANATSGGASSGVMSTEASPPVSSASSQTDWTAGIQNDDLRGWAQNKKYKDVHTAVEAHHNLEKLLGVPADRVIKLPESRDPASMAEVYKRLGRPEKPEGYGFKAPEGGNPELAGWAAKTFHELGLNSEQGKALFDKWNAHVGEMTKAQQSEFENRGMAETQALQKKWGAAFDQNTKIASKGARTFGADGDMIEKMEQAWGYQKTMEFFHRLGAATGEHGFESGSTNGGSMGVMTPDAAKSQIKALRSDPEFVKRYTSGETSTRAEMERLHRMAYPEG